MPKKVEIRVLYNHQQHRFFAVADTGLIIGAALENGTMTFGYDPTKLISRAYIDRDSAVNAIRDLIRADYPNDEVVFLQEEYRAAPSAPPQMPPPHRAQ
jgi:hypothetical protein